jgi:hypothetical protein
VMISPSRVFAFISVPFQRDGHIAVPQKLGIRER